MDLLSPWRNPDPSPGHRERAETSPRNQRSNQSLRRFSSLALLYCAIGLAALSLFPWPALGGELPGLANLNLYEQRDVWGLVTLVNAAAYQIKRQGEKAFPAFREPGRWFDPKDGRYLFIFDLAGNQIVNPAFPEVEGINRLDWRDAWGKPVFQQAIDRLSPEGENRIRWWTHYLWPRPGSSQPEWKSVYLVRARAPSGTYYIVASGLYGLAPERTFVEQLVADAADLVARQGNAAFAVISSHDSPFVFGEVGVFVIDPEGIEHANSVFPDFIGRNLLDPTFPGHAEVRRQLDFARDQGSGWIYSHWPGIEGELAIYLRRVEEGGQTWVLGSWMPRPPARDQAWRQSLLPTVKFAP
jgi:hypothetical protein